ncbi:ribosomal protein S18-alanine N-acetyltransferase [Granulosicoccus antarcticus]|uniref:ribosomal protein S18-alanine N-acetyltransferase n=1 Tax=Granulosicoccus antarcticus TaxID=437505 RepID=UPI0012FDDC57|nr:ribosomal protein S18-alanine N-acetyltransferase [Granulosicoccus antarcticus]
MSASLSAAVPVFAPMRPDHVANIGIMDRRNYEYAWTDGIFRDCLKAGYICPLMMIDDKIIGYGILQIGADEAHVLNLCIDKPWQRQGYAPILLEYLASQSIAKRAHIMFLEVRPSNTRAVELYQRSGFNEIGLRKNYYNTRDGREDALVMARNLPGAEDQFSS